MTRPTVLITGAGSGIGRALAQEAARRGYAPILAGRRPEPLEETALTLPVEARIVVADILTPEGRAALAAAAGDRLDVLINNAGTVEVGPLAGQEDAALARLIETNLTAPILLTRDLLPALRRREGPGGQRRLGLRRHRLSLFRRLFRQQVRPARLLRRPAPRAVGRGRER